MDREISVALYHRDHFSEPQSRLRFGYEAFHWGITILPGESGGGDCKTYDATDSSEIDKMTWRMVNPNMDWWFRARSGDDPTVTAKLLGRIIIGVVPNGISDGELRDLFETIPLPVKDTHPQQSCVTWAVDAIMALQQRGWVWDFQVDQFKDWALAYADERLSGKGSRRELERYAKVAI